MADYTLVLGNKTYSSWSLRGWLLMRQSGAAFDEIIVPLDLPGTRAELLRHSPAGKVPVLRTGDLTVWDSLAIAEFLNERFPEAGLWPADPEARAIARSAASEMHSGFAALRQRLPMDLRRDASGTADPVRDADLRADIARVQELWTECRGRFGQSGEFLFGKFCAADAFFAPVVTRFMTYGVPLEPLAAKYRDAVMSLPAMGDWIAAAKDEPWVIEDP